MNCRLGRAFLSRQQVASALPLYTTRTIMAQEIDHVVARIRKSIAEVRDLQQDAIMPDASATEAHLENTVRELQARVEEQQAALEQVRAK